MRPPFGARVFVWVLRLAGAAIFVAPLVWMVLTTLKQDAELARRAAGWLPELPSLAEVSPYERDGRVHRLRLGAVIAVDERGTEHALEPAQQFDSDEAALIPMDARWAVWSRDSIRTPLALTRRFAMPEGVAPESIERWIIEVGNDNSFHRLGFELATPAFHLVPDEEHVLAGDEAQDVVICNTARTAPRRAELAATPAVREPPASAGMVDLTVRLRRVGVAEAVWSKFTRQYRRALEYLDFGPFLRNSAILVVLNCLGVALASSLVAYGFARLQWIGRDVLFVLLLATMMLPAQVTLIPQFLVWRTLGLYDTLVPLWLPAFLGVPFHVFLLRQFMRQVPVQLDEAARLDGCGPLRIWWSVILPQLKPAMATVVVLQFLATWNEFLGPLIYIADPDKQPLAVGLYIFKSAFAGHWGMIMAACVLMLVPVLVMFALAQRYFVQGVTLSGLKG